MGECLAQVEVTQEAADVAGGFDVVLGGLDGAVGADGTIESAQYNVKATGHVGRLLRDLDLS